MALFISNEDVQNALDRGLLNVNPIISSVENAYRSLAEGEAVYSPRRGVEVPVAAARTHPGFLNENFVFGTMEGADQRTGLFAIRMKLDVTYQLKDAKTNATTHEKYCVEPGRYCGLILLVDTNTAEPLALMNDGIMQLLRVSATNAIAAKYMAREDARTLGLLGSGGMARRHAVTMSRVRPIQRVLVYSPTRENREAFASEMTAELRVPVVAVEGPDDAVREADIVAACTDSNVPVFDPQTLKPGSYLTCVTGSEVDAKTADVVGRIILHQTVESGTVTTYTTLNHRVGPGGRIEPKVNPPKKDLATGPKVCGTLADLVSGRVPGRHTPDEITYFYNNIGSGLQFAAIAGEVYRTLKGKLELREIPLGWLTETVRD